MSNLNTVMRDAHLPLVDRINQAIERIGRGDASMRVPVESTDPDVVLSDCRAEIEKLRKDAERYQWIRGGPSIPAWSIRWPRWELRRWNGRWWNTVYGVECDREIDAAMRYDAENAPKEAEK